MASSIKLFKFKSFIKSINDNDIEKVKFQLTDQELDPSYNDSQALKIATERNFTEIVKLLLGDYRINPSVKNNYAIKEATDNDFIDIINLLYEDDKLELTDLSPNQIIKHINKLSTKMWSIYRIELQSIDKLKSFMTRLSSNETNQQIQLMILDLLNKYNKLNKIDAEIINDSTFRNYFLMMDNELILLLKNNNVPKLNYFTRGQASLLLTYLKNNNKNAKNLLYQTVLLSNKKIIENYLIIHEENESKKYPNIHKILGPVSWTFYKYKGRNIHIFGDWHAKNNPCNSCNIETCMNMSQLINYISKRSVDEKQYTNIFLEATYSGSKINEPIKYKESYLGDLVNDSYSCLQFDKSTCPWYPYSKYHYIDIRHQYGIATGFMPSIEIIGETAEKYATINYITTLKYMQVLEKLSNELKSKPELIFNIYVDKNQGATISEILSKRIGILNQSVDLFKKGTKTHRIRYQLLKIDYQLSKQLRDFFFIKYNKLVTVFLKLMDNDWLVAKENIISKQDVKKSKFALKNINTVLSDLGAIFVDIYFLARMFRSMEWDPSCKLFVAYMGNGHKLNCDEFLKTLEDISIIKRGGDFTADQEDMMSISFALGYKPYQCIFDFDLKNIFGRSLFM